MVGSLRTLLLLLLVAPTTAFRMTTPLGAPHKSLSGVALQMNVAATSLEELPPQDGPPGSSLVAAADAETSKTWVQRLNRISNFASILCAIDCTVFPVLLALLPLAGFAPAGLSEWIHKAAHAVALWFVAPVGGGAVLSNWFQHKKPLVGLWGLSGVALVLLANIHLPHAIMGWHVPHALEHALHDNHRLINVAGCALLLSSQHYAHNLLERMGLCCGHDHGRSHSQSHDHSHS